MNSEDYDTFKQYQYNTPPLNHCGHKAHLARWVLCVYLFLPLFFGFLISLALCECITKDVRWELFIWGLLLIVSIYMSYMILRKWNDYVIVSNQGIEIHIHPGWFVYHRRVDFFIRWIDVKWWRISKRKERRGPRQHWFRPNDPVLIDNGLIIQPKYQEESISFPIEDYHETDRSLPRSSDFNTSRPIFSFILSVFAATYSQSLSSMIYSVAGHKMLKYKRNRRN